MIFAEYERDSRRILLSTDNCSLGLAVTRDEAKNLIVKLSQVLAEISGCGNKSKQKGSGKSFQEERYTRLKNETVKATESLMKAAEVLNFYYENKSSKSRILCVKTIIENCIDDLKGAANERRD